MIYTDPVIVAAIIFVVGYVLGRVHSRRDETIFTFHNPDGTTMRARANTGGREDNETPSAHVDLGG